MISECAQRQADSAECRGPRGTSSGRCARVRVRVARACVSVCARVCVWTHASRVSRVCAVGHGQAWRVSSHSSHGRGRCGQPAGGWARRLPVELARGPQSQRSLVCPLLSPTGGHGLKSWCPWGALRVRVPAPKWNPVLPRSGCAHVRGWAGSESRLLHPATGDSHLRSPASLAGGLGPLQAGGDSGEGPDCGFWSLAAPGSPWEAEARPAECVCPTRDLHVTALDHVTPVRHARPTRPH